MMIPKNWEGGYPARNTQKYVPARRVEIPLLFNTAHNTITYSPIPHMHTTRRLGRDIDNYSPTQTLAHYQERIRRIRFICFISVCLLSLFSIPDITTPLVTDHVLYYLPA